MSYPLDPLMLAFKTYAQAREDQPLAGSYEPADAEAIRRELAEAEIALAETLYSMGYMVNVTQLREFMGSEYSQQ